MKVLQYFENYRTGKLHYKTEDGWRQTTRPGKIYAQADKEDHDNCRVTSVLGTPLKEMNFKTIREVRNFLKSSPETKKHLYGTSRLALASICELYPEEAKVDDFNVCFFDIETEVEEGFPEPSRADERVNMITLYMRGSDTIDVFTICDVEYDEVIKHLENDVDLDQFKLNIVHFDTEYKLLREFVFYMTNRNIDIIGGWNSRKFDIQYICNRIKRLLGEEVLAKISAFEEYETNRYTDEYGEEVTSFKFKGIEQLDFMDVYKKRNFASRENFSLDYISQVELKCGKLKHESGIPGHLLYKHGHASAGLAYNIVDVVRLYQIIEKRKFLDLEIALAQMCSLNISDTEFVTRIVTGYLYKFLKRNNEMFIMETEKKSVRKIEGGYVFPTIPGRHKYMFTADIASSYPSSMRAVNISPEIKGPFIEGHRSTKMCENEDPPEFDRDKYTMAPNGQCFLKSKRGMFPRILDELYDKRNTYKFEKNRLKAAGEKELASVYDSLDKAVKEILNSAYGALSSDRYVFYDPDVGEAVTQTGQLILLEMAKHVINFCNNPKNQNLAVKLYCQKNGFDQMKELKHTKCLHIMGDTDSVGISIEGFVSQLYFYPDDPEKNELERLKFLRWFADNLVQKSIDKAMENTERKTGALVLDILKADREIISPVSLFTSKKKYGMLKFDEEGAEYSIPYPKKIQGLTIVQSSTPDKMKILLNDFMDEMFYDSDKARGKKNEHYYQLRNDMTPDDYAVSQNVKSLEPYKELGTKWTPRKGCPMNYRAALVYNAIAEDKGLPLCKSGEKIKYIFLKKPNKINSDLVGWIGDWPKEFKELGLDNHIDYTRQFSKVYDNQVNKIFESCGFNPNVKASLSLT